MIDQVILYTVIMTHCLYIFLLVIFIIYWFTQLSGISLIYTITTLYITFMSFFSITSHVVVDNLLH